MLTTSKFAKEKRNIITWGLLLAIILSTMNVVFIIEVDSAGIYKEVYITESISYM